MPGNSLLPWRALVVAALTVWVPPVEVQAETDFNRVGREMSGILQNLHYARPKFDAELSERMLATLFEDLDPSRELFTDQDVARLEKEYGRKLQVLLIRSRAMEPAQAVYKVYRQRVQERDGYVHNLLKEEGAFTFYSEETILGSREEAKRPANQKELQKLWTQQLESELLEETLRRRNEHKNPEAKAKQLTVTQKVLRRYERVRRNVEAATEEDIADHFLSAVASSYDPHTEYLSMREYERFQARMKKGLVGIGVTLQPDDDGTVRIVAVVIKGPADKEGSLQLNDRIIGVDPTNKGDEKGMIDIHYMKSDQVVELIKGDAKTKVRLRVKPAKEGAPVHDIVIERGQVVYKDQYARAEIIHSKDEAKGQPRVGYLRIPSFYYDFDDGIPSVTRDVQFLLGRLDQENIDGLVLDLRGNGGGALHEVVKMAGLFLGAKPVVQVKDSGTKVETKSAHQERPAYTGPLVVLTDKASASASEILAGVLQDYNRAVLVGDSSTYGKGSVQQQISIGRFFPMLEDNRRAGFLKPTIQKYYRVSGSSVQLVGVRPDIVLPSRYDAYEYGEIFQRYALPHDTIKKSAGFAPLDASSLHREALAERSAKRIKASQDFQYVREDVARIEADRDRNEVSLNKNVRMNEIEADRARQITRNEERKTRFESEETRDRAQIRIFELTLDDLQADKLREIKEGQERTVYTRRVERDVDPTLEAPEWPSGIGPTKRESIAIAFDLIELTAASRIVKKDGKPKA